MRKGGERINTIRALALLVITASVFGGLSLATTFLGTNYPEPINYIIVGLKYIFGTSAVAPLVVIVRNLGGFYTAKFKKDEKVVYEAKQLYATWISIEEYTKGIGIIVTAATVGTSLAPYSALIAGGLAFVTDLIRSSIEKLIL